MALHTLTIASRQLEFQLPVNAPFTDIEYETGGRQLIPLGCRAGTCGACLIKVISGLEKMSPRDDDEVAFIEVLGYSGEEYRLACQCRIRGDVAIDIVG